MATSQFNSFERVIPNRELFRGKALGALLWSSLASLLLCLVLFDLLLIADLLNNHTFLGDGSWSRGKFSDDALAAAGDKFAMLKENSSALLLLLLVAFVVNFIRSLVLARVATLSSSVAMEIATRLRKTLHRQTLRLGPSDLEDSATDTALGLFTQDVERLREGVFVWVYRLSRHPWELLFLFVFALSIHWRVALQCLVPLAACWYLLQRDRKRSDSSRRLAADRADRELRLLSESFRKTRLVRGYAMESFEHEQFQKHLDRHRENATSYRRGERWSRWFSRLLLTFFILIVLYLVAFKVLLESGEAGALSLAAAISLVATFACMHRPLEALWNLRADRDAAAESAERIHRYLDQIPEVGQAVGAKFLQPLSKSLQFESVSYSLPNKKKLLDGADLKIRAGEVVGIVSLDPLESRAVAYLLPRFIEPQSGRILFDGEDVAWVTLESLRAETIYVGGTDPFFTGTVLENINCGNNEYSLQDVTEAAKQTHAHNFIVKLSEGYDTVLGEHGQQLNAGEGFRLGLARAVLRKPALLIVEEPNELLDDDTKSLLDDAYQRLIRNRTVIFLPKRLSTLRRMDRIVLISQGKVEAIGNHTQLVQNSALYRHWEYLRYNQFDRNSESSA